MSGLKRIPFAFLAHLFRRLARGPLKLASGLNGLADHCEKIAGTYEQNHPG